MAKHPIRLPDRGCGCARAGFPLFASDNVALLDANRGAGREWSPPFTAIARSAGPRPGSSQLLAASGRGL